MAESSDSGGSEKEYFRRTRHVSANWRMLGALLGLEDNQLDVIKQENNNVEDRLMKTLVTWLRSNPDNPEEQLDTALKEVHPVIIEGSTQEIVRITESIQHSIAHFKLEFTNIATKAFEVLKAQQPNPGSLTVWLNELLKGDPNEPLMCESIATNHDQLFLQLQKKWSFTNPDILEQLINYIDDKSLQQSIRDYRKNYKSFCQSMQFSEKLLDKGMQFNDYDPSKPCLVLIIDSGPMTLQEIYMFLDNVFSIYKRYMRVHKIEPGCIKVILQFPLGMKKLIEACVDEKSEFMQQYKEVKIEDPETRAPVEESPAEP